MAPHISIKAESIFTIAGFHVTNSLLLSSLVMIIFIIFAFLYAKETTASKKSGFFYFLSFLLKGIYQMFRSVLGEYVDAFFTILAAFFFYILLQNWFGLLPGVGSILIKVHEGEEIVKVPLLRGNTADLNATLALALVSVLFIQYSGVRILGLKGYLHKFFNFSNPVSFFIGILDIISEISKVISFAFRLFGNIFAGEVLLTIVAFLIPILASAPFLLLEVFVGVVQAFVFAMLTAVFLNGAIAKHH